MEIERTYQYKVFRNNVYLGLLPNVTSDFSYRQPINTGGVKMEVVISQTLDTSPEDVVPLETER
jgi:hypothetical protein